MVKNCLIALNFYLWWDIDGNFWGSGLQPQLQIQIKEKDSLLKQAEKREVALQTTISGFSKAGKEVK